MITQTTVYSAEPAGESGLRALRRRLPFGGLYAPPDIVGPVSALQELRAICAGMLSARGGPNVENRRSFTDDIQRALGSLGPEARAASGALLVNFQSELKDLRSLLDTAQGARIMSLTAGRVLERLATKEVVAAAWRDTVATFVDDSETADQCELRIAQLVELADHRGVDFVAWSSKASGLLGDSPHAYQGTRENVEEALKSGAKLAGVPEARRIALCEQTLVRLPKRTAVAVWLVIDHAALWDGFQAIGPVWLYDHHLWPDAVRSGTAATPGGLDIPAPKELADWDAAAKVFGDLEDSEHRVFARVLVERSTPRDARERARSIIRDLIDLAKYDSAWLLLDGAVSWTTETGWSGEGFKRKHVQQVPLSIQSTMKRRKTSATLAVHLFVAG